MPAENGCDLYPHGCWFEVRKGRGEVPLLQRLLELPRPYFERAESVDSFLLHNQPESEIIAHLSCNDASILPRFITVFRIRQDRKGCNMGSEIALPFSINNQ